MRRLPLVPAGCAVVLAIAGCGGPTATTSPGATAAATATLGQSAAPSVGPSATPSGSEVPASPSVEPSPTATAGLGATGAGVTVVILDRGIDFTNPDFQKPDGTTRVRAALDMSTQANWCSDGRAEPIEYTQEQINDALSGTSPIDFRDAIGHGTATAGLAAGNGSALPDHRYAGVAPEADLVIVKITSEGAPAHGDVAAESAFNGCVNDALAWVDQKITELGQPAVALWNAGSQWGPMDGSSASSRAINQYFPADSPGRIWVATSGDEGFMPNHAALDYGPDSPAVFEFDLTGPSNYPSAWYSGAAPASVTLELSDGTEVGPVAPGQSADENGVTIVQYEPGAEFDPWTSDSGDRAVWMHIIDRAGVHGQITFAPVDATSGHVDLYGDVLGPGRLHSSIEFVNSLVPGRVSDVASTKGVIVTGVYAALDTFIDIDGATRDFSLEGGTGELWFRSSGGPTRDGRDALDITAGGQNVPAPLAAGSWWSDDSFRSDLPQSGEGHYIRFGGTSAAGPIVTGAIALMLEVNPTLTTEQVRAILHSTATADEFTGSVPNLDWGYGKLDIAAAVAGAAAP